MSNVKHLFMETTFYHPRYWNIWILYCLLRLVSLLPYRVQIYLGRMIGLLFKAIFNKRKRIAEINLRLCFPEWSEQKRNEILTKHFESLGISLFEFCISWHWSDSKINRLAHIEGLENLHNALKENNGVIILAGHFTTLEIISRVLKLHTEVHPVYMKSNNPLLEHIISSGRIKHCGKIIPQNDMRSLLRSLRNNIPVLYIPDQNLKHKRRIFVPFFGIQTATIPTTSRLAAIYNTPVIPIIQRRLPDNQGYQLIIESKLENFPTDNLEQDTIRINKIIEKQVRDNPEDYLWVHRRFKSRPPGEKAIY